MKCHCLLTLIVPDEKYAVIRIVSLQQTTCHFPLAAFRNFPLSLVFSSLITMLYHRFLWVYHVQDLLSSLTLPIDTVWHIWWVFSHYLLEYFPQPTPFLSPGTLAAQTLGLLVLSPVFMGLCWVLLVLSFSFSWYSLSCSDCVISIVLSWSL